MAAAGPIRERMTWDQATEEDLATYEFLDAVAFSTVRGLIGLDNCKMAITGAAPIPAELIRWFRTIGIPLAEVYGMSENTGAMTFEREKVKPGTVGKAVPGSEVAIAPDGEVICRGGHVFGGYLNDPEDRPRRSTRTGGCTPATSARSIRGPRPCGSPIARRS